MSGVVEDENVHDPRRGFAGGYHLELASLDPGPLALMGIRYGWGRDFASIMNNYRNLAGMLINGEDLPRPDNRITLSTTVKDKHGLAAAHVHIEEHANDIALRSHAQRQGQRLYDAAGATRTVLSATPPATHNMRTARMSHDPQAGVTDAHGRSHDVPSLFISDGSVLTTGGAANPTLTIVALAFRQADYIGRAIGAGDI